MRLPSSDSHLKLIGAAQSVMLLDELRDRLKRLSAQSRHKCSVPSSAATTSPLFSTRGNVASSSSSFSSSSFSFSSFSSFSSSFSSSSSSSLTRTQSVAKLTKGPSVDAASSLGNDTENNYSDEDEFEDEDEAEENDGSDGIALQGEEDSLFPDHAAAFSSSSSVSSSSCSSLDSTWFPPITSSAADGAAATSALALNASPTLPEPSVGPLPGLPFPLPSSTTAISIDDALDSSVTAEPSFKKTFSSSFMRVATLGHFTG